MNKEQKAIERLKLASEMSLAYYGQPLIVTTSGGKDSDVCIALALRAGIPFEVQHSHMTADAPETVYYVRKTFARLEDKGIKCTINKPVYLGKPVSMWQLIPQKMFPPTRVTRYCCDVLKEGNCSGRMITTGARWAESVKRKNNRGIYETLASDIKNKIILSNDNDDKRRLFEHCTLKAKRVCNPIIDWTDADVWNYINTEHIETNPLYQCGFSRVGCIGCPLASRKSRQFELAQYPKYKDMYIRAFDRMLKARREKGLPTKWDTAEDVMHWWMEDGVLPGQIGFDEVET